MADGKPSKNTQKSAARLLAVQAVYALISQQKSSEEVIPSFLDNYAGMDVEGEEMVKPDEILFRSIVEGAENNFSDLENKTQDVLKNAEKQLSKDKEPLLFAIIVCGLFEIYHLYPTDIAIIINDYLNVTHAFFEQGEAKLVHAVLDQAAKALNTSN